MKRDWSAAGAGKKSFVKYEPRSCTTVHFSCNAGTYGRSDGTGGGTGGWTLE